MKKIITKVANIIPPNKLYRLRKGPVALFYHGVYEGETINPVVQESNMPLKIFEKQIKYLKKNYEIISMEFFADCIHNGYKTYPNQVIITFDDGYKSNYNIVMPFLSSYEIPFSIFICTNHIGTDTRLPYYYLQAAIYYSVTDFIYIPSINKRYEVSTEDKRLSAIKQLLTLIKTVDQQTVRLMVNDFIQHLPFERWVELNNMIKSEELMSWHNVRTLNKAGVTIGSHCHDHAILHSNQTEDEIDYQLATSKKIIEDQIGVCKYFAFPNGTEQHISHYSVKSLKKNNYLLGFTTVAGEICNERGNRYILPRICPRKDFEKFKFLLNYRFLKNNKYNKWSRSL